MHAHHSTLFRFVTLALVAGLGSQAYANEEEYHSPSADIVQTINSFGIDLFRAALNQHDGGNVLLSPFNLARTAFLLDSGVSDGSSYETGASIGALFGLDGADGLTNLAMATAELSSKFQEGGDAGPLRLASTIWTQPHLSLRPDHETFLAEVFAVSVEQVDFSAPDTLDRINAEIAAQTGGMISPMLTDLDSSTQMLLADAMHFKADWRVPFDPAQTFRGPFFAQSDREIEVEFMALEGSFPFWQTDEIQFVALPFEATGDGLKFEVVIGLPAENADVSAWSGDDWRGLLGLIESSAATRPLAIELPRVSVQAGGDMVAVFEAAGFDQMFTTPFETISDPALHIDSLVHRASLEWDETGAEAAAATALNMVRALPVELTHISVDRPFLVFLREAESGAILLMGTIDSP